MRHADTRVAVSSPALRRASAVQAAFSSGSRRFRAARPAAPYVQATGRPAAPTPPTAHGGGDDRARIGATTVRIGGHMPWQALWTSRRRLVAASLWLGGATLITACAAAT